MAQRGASAAAALAVAGMLGWVGVTTLDGAPSPAASRSAPRPGAVPRQSREGGSEVPCDTPLAWSVARVDPGFGMTRAEVEDAVVEAAAMWEAAFGRRLFVRDDDRGFPIRLVFDERQERTRARLAAEADLARSQSEVDGAGAAVRAREAEHMREQARYQERLDEHERRVADHNAEVRRLSARAEVPAEVFERLRASGEALERERDELRDLRRRLETRADSLRTEERRIERMIADGASARNAFTRRFPSVPVESGVYREAVRRENGRLVSISREIRLYRFADARELRVVAAHELGHALGLGHSADEGAVMSEEQGDAPPPDAVRATEAGRLAALCEAARRVSPRGGRGVEPPLPTGENGLREPTSARASAP